jgi:hypothetical protein
MRPTYPVVVVQASHTVKLREVRVEVERNHGQQMTLLLTLSEIGASGESSKRAMRLTIPSTHTPVEWGVTYLPDPWQVIHNQRHLDAPREEPL